MDPEGSSSGFYRSLVTHPTLTTSMVVGTVDTDARPGVVGRARPRLRAYSGARSAGRRVGRDRRARDSDAAGRRYALLRAEPAAATGPGGVALVEVETLGEARSTAHAGRRSSAPRQRGPADPRRRPGGPRPRPTAMAPRMTTLTASSETAAWRIRFRDANGNALRDPSARARGAATWDGAVDGTPVPKGPTAIGSTPPMAGRTRATRPGRSCRPHWPLDRWRDPAGRRHTWFSPNGDGVRETVVLGGIVSERGSVVVHVRDEGGTPRPLVQRARPRRPSRRSTWDGKGNDGTVVPDGRYDIRLTPRDAVGNTGTPRDAVRHGRGLPPLGRHFEGGVLPAGSRHALDRDPSVVRPAATGLGDLDHAQRRRQRRRDAARWRRGGRRDGDPQLVRDRQRGVVAADRALLVGGDRRRRHAQRVQAVAFEMNAFGIRPSASAATRGRSITISVTSAEALSTEAACIRHPARPSRPGQSHSRTSTGTYKATLTMKSAGRSGTVTPHRASRRTRPAAGSERPSRCRSAEGPISTPPDHTVPVRFGTFGALLQRIASSVPSAVPPAEVPVPVNSPHAPLRSPDVSSPSASPRPLLTHPAGGS